MTIRKAVFWTHLGAGVTACLVIVMMSVTGALLTYERQLREWADRGTFELTDPGEQPLSVDALLAATLADNPDASFSSIGIHSRPDMPPVASRGRAITGASNLLFLFLVVSGIYLWLPPLWRWVVIRQRLFFNPKAKTAKARDYNWHHVFGFWIFIPLFLIVLSATPISYPWARNTVYILAGEPVPVRGGGRNRDEPSLLEAGTRVLALQSLFEKARAHSADWRRIDVAIPSARATTVDVTIDEGTGGEPHKKTTLTFDRVSGDIVGSSSFADRTPASKVLSYFRWVHTGEAHGLVGQTIAGIVSALAVLMAWTGVALSWRRLISPILRRRRLNRT